MLSLFLDCPARIGIACPNATTVEEVTQAIKQGDITWHALPHNAQASLLLRGGCSLKTAEAAQRHRLAGSRKQAPPHLLHPCCSFLSSPRLPQIELFDASLLSYAVHLTHDLDRQFGVPPKVTMSQRDVPGLTRAAIPVLAFAGVKAVSGA